MAVTAPQPNNVPVKFLRKSEQERPRMPSVSKVQNAAMHAAAEGKSTLGIPKKVGEEFVEAQPKGSVGALPKRKNKLADKLRARGLISDKAAQKAGIE